MISLSPRSQFVSEDELVMSEMLQAQKSSSWMGCCVDELCASRMGFWGVGKSSGHHGARRLRHCFSWIIVS